MIATQKAAQMWKVQHSEMQTTAKVDHQEEQAFEVDAGIEPMHLHYHAADHRMV